MIVLPPTRRYYLRLSRDDANRGESESIHNQRALLREYAARQGFSMADEYVDDGWPGTNFDRPRFQDMLRDMEQHRFDIVLVKDLSRLGRDYIQIGRYIELVFPEHGVRLIAVNDGLDTARADTDMAPFRNVVNEMYARDTSRKIRSALRAKMQEGKFVGNFAPYGYQKDPRDKNHLIPDGYAAQIVRQILFGRRRAPVRRRSRGGWVSAGNRRPRFIRCQAHPELNPDCYSKHKEWTAGGVSRILRDTVYLGCIVQGKTDKISFKSKKTREKQPEEWIVVPERHEPLVSVQTFETVQHQRASAAVAGKGRLKISFRAWRFVWTAARPCPRSVRGKRVRPRIWPAAHTSCTAHRPALIILSRMRACIAACWRRCAGMPVCPRRNATTCLNA